jgi:GntR family transcriptional regulator of arabinose operon
MSIDRNSFTPMYIQLKELIKEKIKSGEYLPGQPIPSGKELSKKLGVSTITVRQAVTELIREDFLQGLQGKGVFVADQAEPLPAKVPSLIASLFPYSIEGNCVIETFIGIQDAASKAGFNHILHIGGVGDVCKSERDAVAEMRKKGALGFIIYPEATAESLENVRELESAGIPYVLLDKYFEELNSSYVGIDESAGAEEIVRYLISKGHTKIAYIGNTMRHSSSRDRRKGFLRAMRGHNLPVPDDFIWRSDGMGLSELACGAEGAGRILRMKNPPTAFVCVNYNVSCGVHSAVRMTGASDFESRIVAFDSIPEPKISIPHLDWPRAEIGRTALRMLAERIKNPGLSTGVEKLSPHLIVPLMENKAQNAG